MSFDKIFDLTAGVYLNFYNIFDRKVMPRERYRLRFVRTRPGDEECTTLLQEIKPTVVTGNVELGESGVDIVQAFVRWEARTLLFES